MTTAPLKRPRTDTVTTSPEVGKRIADVTKNALRLVRDRPPAPDRTRSYETGAYSYLSIECRDLEEGEARGFEGCQELRIRCIIDSVIPFRAFLNGGQVVKLLNYNDDRGTHVGIDWVAALEEEVKKLEGEQPQNPTTVPIPPRLCP